jgi:hypothetical protein
MYENLIPEPKEGDLRWWHFFAPSDLQRYMHKHRVASIEDAKIAIREQVIYDLEAKDDLGNDLAYMNCFGLEVFHEGEWEEWYGPHPADADDEICISDLLDWEDERDAPEEDDPTCQSS